MCSSESGKLVFKRIRTAGVLPQRDRNILYIKIGRTYTTIEIGNSPFVSS